MKNRADTPGVSIIVCTNRPRFFANIIANYRTQQTGRKELIIILNKDSMNLERYRMRVRAYPEITVYKVPERTSLGQCLNCGIAKARYPLIAKFDDDDYYSPYYLKEQLQALKRTGSDIVGKHACLVYLEASRRLIIRSPGEQHKPVVFLSGGTVLFRKAVTKQVLFPDRSVGEDVNFLRRCRRKGYRAFATSPYNYVYLRRKNKNGHTWKAEDSFYLEGSIPVAITRNYRSIADRKL
ncbi:glycosyltransferase family 2 protein [Paenibacillus sp. NFR01]|uniref:glycosyltransferase n=1 Tax=Paenibacillus sp. NFR01 TaxID=1566279 RepID=UPI0008BAD9BD|nr:glycosyltransferase [Paenibacillus sp. NFR01]SET61090.1 Glycosyltransferase like family 2 [Paenibacillus sp. NFR01]